VEFGAFSPILRTHTTKNPDSERRIWVYPEPYSSILRKTFQLRYAMQPYIYTEARRTYDTGVAFLRPLYYDWPEAPEAYTNKNEYLFGDAMLVAPVVAAVEKVSGLATERVWLPEGEWIEWQTGKHIAGPVAVDRSFSIEQTPVYVKAGAIVPMQPPMQYTGEKPVDPLIVNVWPLKPEAKSSYSVYEDSGKSVEYQQGVYACTPIAAVQEVDTLRVEIGPAQGSYPGMPKTRGYELRLPGDWPPASVTVNGAPVAQAGPAGEGGWRFEGNTLTTIIPVSSGAVDQKVTIEVRRASGLTARRGELDGFTGAMSRLRAVYDAINVMSRVTAPPDPLVDAMQSGDRLGYHPEKAVEEVVHFRAVLPQAQSAVAGQDNQIRQRIEETLKFAQDEHKSMGGEAYNPDAQRQRWLDALAKAEKLVGEAGK
jgi:alpha-glucosidase